MSEETETKPKETELEKAWKRLAHTGSPGDLRRLNKARRNAR